MSVFSQFLPNPIQTINDESGIGLGPTASGTVNVLGTYVQVIASTAHTVRNLVLVGQTNNPLKNYRVVIATGGAGSEVIKANVYVSFSNATTGIFRAFIPLDPSLIPKGVRVAVAISNMTDGTAGVIGLTVALQEGND